jgi:hypothetical protein
MRWKAFAPLSSACLGWQTGLVRTGSREGAAHLAAPRAPELREAGGQSVTRHPLQTPASRRDPPPSVAVCSSPPSYPKVDAIGSLFDLPISGWGVVLLLLAVLATWKIITSSSSRHSVFSLYCTRAISSRSSRQHTLPLSSFSALTFSSCTTRRLPSLRPPLGTSGV